jgi:hypothetical protein
LPNAKKIADEIADALDEKQYGPRKLVRDVVEQCGADFAHEVLHDTLEVMNAGGMLTNAGDRLRTKGGVFFYLARGRMSDETREAIFPPRIVRDRRKEQVQTAHLPEFDWTQRAEVIQPLLAEQGEVKSVNITLIGHPGKVETRRDVVITTMSHTGGISTLPRGVPPLPETPTVYTVYISLRQWNRIEGTLENAPEDPLIIEGVCAFDPTLQTVTVHATRVTTRALEIEKRMQQDTTRNVPVEPAAEPKPAAVSKPAFEIPEGAPADVAQKLRDLHAAADLYRQKIATLEAKPADQRFGLEMTQKLLGNVENEIATLEKQYA